MRKLQFILLFFVLSPYCARPVQAQIFRGPDASRKAEKAAEKSQKTANKAAKKRQKAIEKTIKKQQKAIKKSAKSQRHT